MRFPRIVIPLSVAVTALLNLGMTLVAVFIFTLANGIWPTLELARADPMLVLLAMLAAGVGMLLSVALRPLSRHAADLGGRGPDAVLRLAGPLRGDDGA